jgi:hypothetical protein
VGIERRGGERKIENRAGSPARFRAVAEGSTSAQLSNVLKQVNRIERKRRATDLPVEGSISAQLSDVLKQVNRIERKRRATDLPVEGSISAQLSDVLKQVQRIERKRRATGLPVEGSISAQLSDVLKQVQRIERKRRSTGLPVERLATPYEQFGDLTGEIRLMLEAISDALPWKPQELVVRVAPGEVAELVIKVEPGEAAELGKAKVRQIKESMQSKELHQVTEQELELFIRRMLTSVEKVGIETITRTANEVVRDHFSTETLLKIPEQTTSHLTEMAERVTSRITPPDGTGRRSLRRLVLAAALLLALGASIFVPLIAPVAAQIILANEIAVATLTATVATLIKDHQGRP